MPISPLPRSTTELAICMERRILVAETPVKARKRPIVARMEFDRQVAVSLLRQYQLP